MFDRLELSDEVLASLRSLHRFMRTHDPTITEKDVLRALVIYSLLNFTDNRNPSYHRIYRPTAIEAPTKKHAALRNNLKAIIKASGKTQRQIADEIGINYVYLSALVKGKYEPGITTVLLLMEALNCPVNTFENLFYLEPVP